MESLFPSAAVFRGEALGKLSGRDGCDLLSGMIPRDSSLNGLVGGGDTEGSGIQQKGVSPWGCALGTRSCP